MSGGGCVRNKWIGCMRDRWVGDGCVREKCVVDGSDGQIVVMHRYLNGGGGQGVQQPPSPTL
jgi:hypothetical protein